MKGWYLTLYGTGILGVLSICTVGAGCYTRPATAFMAGIVPGVALGFFVYEFGGILTDSFGRCRWCGKESK